jgi:hypothetical protein
VVKQGYAELPNMQSARAHDVARMATPDRVGMPPCRRTRTPRQACARWVEHRVLVPIHDACGFPGRCHVLIPHALDGGTASRHWPDGRRASPPIPPYPVMPCLYCLTPCLGEQGSTQPPQAGL